MSHLDSSPTILSLDYPPNDGGISRLAAGLIQALHRDGLLPIVVTSAAEGRKGLQRPAVEHLEVERRKGLRDWQILSIIRKHHRDSAILATVWNPEATLAILAGARRVSILAHGNEVMPYARNGTKSWLRRIVLERAHIVICNSFFTEKLVQKVAPKAKTAVVHPAVEADAFSLNISQGEARQKLKLPSQARILLTVARLDPIKGHETVLRAIAELPPEERKDMLYVIIGKGRERDYLQKLTLELGIDDQVQFAGFVADEDLLLWYAAADLFLLCSVVDPLLRGMEGFGMALTEAQAAGIPVIGTRSGGIPDAIKEDEGGWLIDEGDYQALAKHLLALGQDAKAFADQGARGAQRVRREMSWVGYAARIRELI